MRNQFKSIIKLLVSMFIIAFLFYRLDTANILSVLNNVIIIYILAGFCLIFIALFLMTLKFRQFVKYFTNISLIQLLHIYWASDFLSLMGLGLLGSEAYKMISFKSKKEALIASLTDKAYSFIWCLVFLLAHLISFLLTGSYNQQSIVLSFVFFLLVILIIIFFDKKVKLILLNYINNIHLRKIIELSYIEKISLFKHSLYSLFYIHTTFFIYSIILFSVGVYPRLELLLFIPAIIILTTLPISIQGLGVREIILVQYAMMHDLNIEIILAGSLLIFFVYMIYRLTGAIPFLLVKNIQN